MTGSLGVWLRVTVMQLWVKSGDGRKCYEILPVVLSCVHFKCACLHNILVIIYVRIRFSAQL